MTTQGFKDHFSEASDRYASYRPGYPAALFAWLAEQAPERELAWDCATGSGQAACALAAHFAQVVATDASASQVEHAAPCPGVRYAVAPAEHSGLAARSVSLVTVAQALHWFELDGFYAELRRVLRPQGVVAVWTYNLLTIAPEIDAVVNHLYGPVLDAYWPPERRHVESGYRELPFPFTPIEAPAFAMQAQWTLPQLLGYLRTWSAVRRYQAATGTDPVAATEAELLPLWGEAEQARPVRWPLALRIGRLEAAA